MKPKPIRAFGGVVSVEKELSNHSVTPQPASDAQCTVPQAMFEAPTPELRYSRPCVTLTLHLKKVFKMINTQHCIQIRSDQADGNPKFNGGYDDKEGHYIVLSGEVILDRYIVQEVLGKGSFGIVIRCFDEKRKETVAVKITRNGMNFRSLVKQEVDILLKLNNNPKLTNYVVKLWKVFDWKGHLVLVFELLSLNLYQLIKYTKFQGVGVDLVRKFAYQLMQALHQFETHRPPIIHCDIKPENILLRHHRRSLIRLIDFGSACYGNKTEHKYIQSRFYRSPEVIMNLQYGTAIDRWSVGCLLVELHIGVPLFDGNSESEQLRKIQSLLGPMPSSMIRRSSKKNLFYNEIPTSNGEGHTYTLKGPLTTVMTLEEMIGIRTRGKWYTSDTSHDEVTYIHFVDFIKGLLTYDPEVRLSCTDALKHPFLDPHITRNNARLSPTNVVAEPIETIRIPE